MQKRYAAKSNTANFSINPTLQTRELKVFNFMIKISLCCGEAGYLIRFGGYKRLNNPIIITKRTYLKINMHKVKLE